MRVALVLGCSVALLLSACGGSKSVGTGPPGSSTSGPTATTVAGSTTSVPCPTLPIPATPVTSPATVASLLTNVHEVGDPCVDDVIFDFTAKGNDPPGYTLTYGTPPFVADGSGAAVAVAGKAFVVLKIEPGYGYDFEAAKQTYNGPKSVPVGRTNHVQAIVETGDFEGVLTWVIGLDAKRPFRVQATGAPRHQLVVTIS